MTPDDETTMGMALAALDAAELLAPKGLEKEELAALTLIALVRALGVLTGDAAGAVAGAELAWAMLTNEDHRFLFIEAFERACQAREIGAS